MKNTKFDFYAIEYFKIFMKNDYEYDSCFCPTGNFSTQNSTIIFNFF